MAVKPKDNRTSLKREFKSFAIPFYLRDENLNHEQANEWQSYLLDGRSKGFGSRSYAWGLFNVKYYKSEESKAWVERAVRKHVVGLQKEAFFKRLLEIVLGGRDKAYANFSEIVDEIIKDLIKFRDGVCDVENEMKEHEQRPKPLEIGDFITSKKKKPSSAVLGSAVLGSAASALAAETAQDVIIDALKSQPLIDVNKLIDNKRMEVPNE